MARKPKLSIIIPVYQQWEQLLPTLKSLSEQTLSADLWECFVVDNGSDEIPDATAVPPYVKILHCEKPGSYAARNYALDFTQGELVVFTDADCIPDNRWLSVLWERFTESNKRTVIAGNILVKSHSDNRPNAAELYDIVLGLPQKRYVSRGYAVTANLAVPKCAFKDVGKFDDNRYSGGDAEFTRRATRSGYQLTYCHEALVYHPARNSIKLLSTKTRRVKGGQLLHGTIGSRIKYLTLILAPPLRNTGHVFRCSKVTFSQKLMVYGLLYYLWLVGVSEVFRLLLFQSPERR